MNQKKLTKHILSKCKCDGRKVENVTQIKSNCKSASDCKNPKKRHAFKKYGISNLLHVVVKMVNM